MLTPGIFSRRRVSRPWCIRYRTLGSSLVLTVIMNAVTPHLYWLLLWARKEWVWRKRRGEAVSQAALNNLTKGARWEVRSSPVPAPRSYAAPGRAPTPLSRRSSAAPTGLAVDVSAHALFDGAPSSCAAVAPPPAEVCSCLCRRSRADPDPCAEGSHLIGQAGAPVAATARPRSPLAGSFPRQVSVRYAEIAVIFAVCLAYSAGIPILLPVGALSFLLFYWVEKVLFVHFYQTPPQYSPRLTNEVIT